MLPAKGNQGTLHEDVQVRFSDPEAQEEMPAYQHVGGGHGRVETRVATVSHDVGWPGLKAVGGIEAVRELKGRTERAVCQCRSKIPQKCRSKIPHFFGVLAASQISRRFGSPFWAGLVFSARAAA